MPRARSAFRWRRRVLSSVRAAASRRRFGSNFRIALRLSSRTSLRCRGLSSGECRKSQDCDVVVDDDDDDDDDAKEEEKDDEEELLLEEEEEVEVVVVVAE